MLRVLLGGPPDGLSPIDATQGLAFLAMLFNVTSVVRAYTRCMDEWQAVVYAVWATVGDAAV